MRLPLVDNFPDLTFIIISKPPLQVCECKIELLHLSKKGFTMLQLAECLHTPGGTFLKIFVNLQMLHCCR